MTANPDLDNIVFPSLKERVVIITGAGQGIGRVFAKAFALAGARAVIAELDENKATSVAAEIMKADGEALAVTTDVADPASIDEMIEVVTDKYCRIDVLINNAAIFSTLEMRPFEQIPLKEWEQVLRVNVTGAFLCARGAAGDAAARLGPHRQHGLGRGVARAARLSALHRLEGSADRHEPLDGSRARQGRHYRQRHLAGRDIHRDRAQDRDTRAEGAHHRDAMRATRRGAGRPGRRRPLPGL
jgi:NAD(P)-dependent dehydrogenase (short-subunit alcohol dehydrogenase family)